MKSKVIAVVGMMLCFVLGMIAATVIPPAVASSSPNGDVETCISSLYWDQELHEGMFAIVRGNKLYIVPSNFDAPEYPAELKPTAVLRK